MRAALISAVVVGSSCAPSRHVAHATPKETPAPPVIAPLVLVTIDGARWQEIFEGTDPALSHAAQRPSRELVPRIDRLVRERGAAIGSPGRGVISATGPNFVSLPGYTELLTGRAPIGCQSNTCAPIRIPTGVGDFRPDRLTAELALRHLETQRPDVLYVSLGEPDEYGHHDDYPGYLRALAFADAWDRAAQPPTCSSLPITDAPPSSRAMADGRPSRRASGWSRQVRPSPRADV